MGEKGGLPRPFDSLDDRRQLPGRRRLPLRLHRQLAEAVAAGEVPERGVEDQKLAAGQRSEPGDDPTVDPIELLQEGAQVAVELGRGSWKEIIKGVAYGGGDGLHPHRVQPDVGIGRRLPANFMCVSCHRHQLHAPSAVDDAQVRHQVGRLPQ